MKPEGLNQIHVDTFEELKNSGEDCGINWEQYEKVKKAKEEIKTKEKEYEETNS
jgi:hypothetical protein